jgi:hypothetical protein
MGRPIPSRGAQVTNGCTVVARPSIDCADRLVVLASDSSNIVDALLSGLDCR